MKKAKIGQTTAFWELWRFDYPERLSLQRLAQRWGWIGENLFHKKHLRLSKKAEGPRV
jgi:hypothetical protein